MPTLNGEVFEARYEWFALSELAVWITKNSLAYRNDKIYLDDSIALEGSVSSLQIWKRGEEFKDLNYLLKKTKLKKFC